MFLLGVNMQNNDDEQKLEFTFDLSKLDEKTAEEYRDYLQQLARFIENIKVIRANNPQVADTLMKKFEACSLSAITEVAELLEKAKKDEDAIKDTSVKSVDIDYEHGADAGEQASRGLF